MRVGLIGAGIMGHGVAVNLLAAGHDVSLVVHRNRAPIDDLVARGATEAETPEALAEGIEALVLCVSTSDVVRDLVGRIGPHLPNDAMVVDLTTHAAEAPAEIAGTLATFGVVYVEAPVTGGAAQARDGRLGAIVGCDPVHLDRAHRLLSSFCARVEHFGPPGAGTRAKLVSNFLALGTATLAIETFRQARALGVDWQKLYDLALLGSGNSVALRRIMDAALQGDFTGYAFSIENTAKDLGNHRAMLSQAGLDSALSEALLKLHRDALSAGDGARMIGTLLAPDSAEDGVPPV